MRNHTFSSEQIQVSPAEVGDEDGRVPTMPSAKQRVRRARRAESHGQRADRKAWQLCRQVAVTLDEVLAECGDGVLRGLHVVSVTPFPDASALARDLDIDRRPAGRRDRSRKRFESSRARHRPPGCEIASAVTRKRACPDLPARRTQGGRDGDGIQYRPALNVR